MHFLAVILASLASQIAAPGSKEVLIFDAGTHCRRGMVEPHGSGWLAICQTGNRIELLGVRVRMRSATGEGAGRVVRADVMGCATPLLLIKGTAFQAGQLESAEMQPRGFAFRGQEYWLVDRSNDRLAAVWVLLMGTNGPSAIVGRNHGVQIRWAGDLNRDGKPDLVVENSYPMDTVTLWLSTGTKPDARLHAVAEARRSVREGSLTQACSGRADARR
jgi:hypothetical protein